MSKDAFLILLSFIGIVCSVIAVYKNVDSGYTDDCGQGDLPCKGTCRGDR